MKLAIISVLVSLLGVSAGCGSNAPTVEIVDAGPLALDASDDAHDDLTLHLRYTDPDGDLGGGKVEVYDCRADGIVTTYALPEIASKQAEAEGVAIGGTLTVIVPDVGVVTSASTPEVCRALGASATSFCVVLVDAAGDASEGACTKGVTVSDGQGV